jgi:hypothetical protein
MNTTKNHTPARQRITLAFTAVAAAALLTGCGESSTSTAATSDAPWVLASAPDGAMSVTEAKAEMNVGDTIILRARIGGSRTPISDASAVFTVMDLAIPHCGENPNDACPMPWDYCCETPETITANAATVQVVDASGTPIGDSVSVYGFAPLDEIIVVGTVGPRPNQEVLTIRARGIHRIDG